MSTTTHAAPAGSRATRGLLPHPAMFTMILSLWVALGFIVLSPTPARSDPPTADAMAPPPIASSDERTYRAHPIFLDFLVGSTAIGVVNGVVQGQCNGTGFQGNLVVGAAFVGGLCGLFAGASYVSSSMRSLPRLTS